MNSGRQHVAPNPYDRAEVSTRGLACPFAQSDPETYMNIDACRPFEGFKEPRLLFEHVWRKHTRFFRCGFCRARWSISMSRKKVQEKKEEHWESCEGKRRGVLYFDGPDENGIELMDWKQQELFEKTRSMRDVGAKLEALYRACRKPVPQTYRWSTSLDATAAHPGQQSVNHGEGIFEGLARPVTGTEHLPQRRTTAINVSKTTAALQAEDSSAVSGADRSRDEDSGYVSMPKNGRDRDDALYADSLPARPGTQWHAPHEARSYAMSGSHLSAASPEYFAGDDDNFANMQGNAVHDCLQDYDSAGALLLGPSRDLLGLTLPDPGAENPEGPVNIGDFTNLDADFSVYPDSVYPGEILFPVTSETGH